MATGKHLLFIVTADREFGQGLHTLSVQNGYTAVLLRGTDDVLAQARDRKPALLIVDRRQKELKGLKKHLALRDVPFIGTQPLYAECSDDACIEDLDEGIDVVVCKREYVELIARIRAVLRREHMKLTSKACAVGPVRLDVESREVTVDGRPIELTAKEFHLLHQFLYQPGKVFSRHELLDKVWGHDCVVEEHTLTVHIHSLRQKLERDPLRPTFIVTVRGVGYKLKAEC